MSKSNTLENAYLLLLFHGTAFADIAQNDSSSPLTSFYVSLHTSDPGEAGDQTTNEIAYTGYARQAVTRDSGGFNVSGNIVTFVDDVEFPIMTAGAGGTVTHFGIGTDASGAGRLLYSGTVDPDILVAVGVEPIIDQSSSITED